MPKKTLLSALFLLACLSAIPLCLAADHAPVPASPASIDQAAAGALDTAGDPGFATWLASQEAALISPPATAAKCPTCADCPSSKPFCCITSPDGCASCFSRPVFCQPL